MHRMTALAVLLLAAASLTACGDDAGRRAAKACASEASSRLAGKTFEIDLGTLVAKPADGGVIGVTGPVVFERNLPGEYVQTLECRVRFDGDAPSVIFLQFNWTMDAKPG